MKKKALILMAAIAIIGIGILVINACSKSDQKEVATTGKITHFSSVEDQVVPLITQFNQRYKNYKAGYKSGGDINLGEAEWTIEAAVNYEFRGEKENLEELISDSLLLTTEVFLGENNEFYISENDAFALYEDLLEFSTEKVTNEIKLLVADVELKQIVDGVAEIKLITVVLGGPPNPCTLNSTDWWYPVLDLGKCNGYSESGKDASDRIRGIINCSEVQADYWTDIETFYGIYNGYYPCDEEYCFWEGESSECLSSTNMVYWKNKAQNVVNQLKPEGKSRIEAFFDYDVIVQGVLYVHYFNYISYGIPHSGGGGGE